MTLLAVMGNPQEAYPSIHIAGTNGKGSVSAMVSGVLIEAGYRIGIFTSPHLHSYCERFRIDREMIQEQRLEEVVRSLEPGIEECVTRGLGQPTEFEVLTAAAFVYFQQEGVDLAVVETGMGGIYDSTNVLKRPLVTVITNVQKDHEAYLGSEVAEIAANKAGIAKLDVPLICGDQASEVAEILRQMVMDRGGIFSRSDQGVELKNITNLGMEGFLVDYQIHRAAGQKVKFSLAGSYQMQNLTTALAVLNNLNEQGFNVSSDAINRALGRMTWPGRVELVHRQPDVVLDAAHNPHGARGLARALRDIYPERSKILVVGVVDDKNGPEIFKELKDMTRLCIVTRPEGARGKNWMQKLEEARGIFAETIGVEQIEEAVKTGIQLAEPDEYLLVTGSFYTLDRARRLFTDTY
ncbi:MAG: bifunctional folylpolyglutamate synthase/dihydrofolate synthase [Ignavibacteriales bacterium]